MKQKHLILLVADQLRYDMLGRGLTPHIDEIISKSVKMERTYCASPLCVPARGALFTGTYPNCNGSLINPWWREDAQYGDVHKGIETIYELMERSDRECLHSGKQHLFTEGGKLENRSDSKTKWLSTHVSYNAFLKEEGVRAPGGEKFRAIVPEMTQGKYTRFTRYSNAHTGCYKEGLKYYFDGYFTDQAIKGLKERDKEKPLFFSGMFLAPHPPFEIPEPFFSSVALEEVQLPENVGTWYKYQSPLQLYNLTGVIGTRYAKEEWYEKWRVYMGIVKLLDDCVGRLIEELKNQGIYDDCMIIFTSDHGEMLGSHQLFQKMCMYEESVRTPTFIRFPNDEFSGTSLIEPISHIDILPTICDYMDLELSNPIDGHSLMPNIRGEKLEKHPIFIQFDGNGARSNFQRCIICGDNKLIADVFKDEIYYEFYNIKEDIQETENLLFNAQPPLEEAKKMLALLVDHMKKTDDKVTLFDTDLDKFITTYTALGAPTK